MTCEKHNGLSLLPKVLLLGFDAKLLSHEVVVDRSSVKALFAWDFKESPMMGVYMKASWEAGVKVRFRKVLLVASNITAPIISTEGKLLLGESGFCVMVLRV